MKCLQTDSGSNFLIGEGEKIQWNDIFVILAVKASPFIVLDTTSFFWEYFKRTDVWARERRRPKKVC
jgi:hypothetical protein